MEPVSGLVYRAYGERRGAVISQERRVKVSKKIYLLVLWSALLSPLGASALGGKTTSWQDSAARIRSGQGRIQLAQIQSDARWYYIPKSSGQVGTPLHLAIMANPNEAMQRRTLVFKKLLSTYTFSPGVRIDDTHYVSFTDFDKVTITVSKEAPPEAILSVVFLNDDGSRELHELKIGVAGTVVNIFEADGRGAETPAPFAVSSPRENPVSSMASAVPLTETPTAAGPAPIDPALENSYLQRAEGLLRLGQIAAARLLLEHVANKGSARGALRLGETYDADYLKLLNVVGGVSADKNSALRWYRKAQELGADEASAHIQRLN